MPEPLFARAGALRPFYDEVDWASTSLGPVAAWSPELRLTLGTVLTTRFPATLLWGPELVLLYNAAYVPLIADKHPGALGRPAREVFPEAWDVIGPMLTGVLQGAGPTWVEDSRLLLERRGFAEACFFTFSYSPVAGQGGEVAGVLDIAVETTRQILDRRRLALLARLSDQMVELGDGDEIVAQALPLLRSNALDLPAVGVAAPGARPRSSDSSTWWDSRLPAAVPAALTDREVFVQDTADGRVAWLRLPGSQAREQRPLLAVLLSPHLLPDREYLQFLTLVAQSLGTAREQAHTRKLERDASWSARSMSAQLQRSLLTALPQPDDLQLVGRYQPAAKDQQIGGDWYDAFTVADGGTCLVVGDVTGHDRSAAVSMAQLRNILRGVGYAYAKPPARVLETLDKAIRDLELGALATAVLARVEQTDGQHEANVRLLRWSNAGHPPPLLVHPAGDVEILTRPTDLLLGLGMDTPRHDHTQLLRPGSTVLMYTDGLVERRRGHLSDGLDWLRRAVEGLAAHQMSLDELCDDLLAQVGDDLEDDVAILALRAHPQDGPRPG